MYFQGCIRGVLVVVLKIPSPKSLSIDVFIPPRNKCLWFSNASCSVIFWLGVLLSWDLGLPTLTPTYFLSQPRGKESFALPSQTTGNAESYSINWEACRNLYLGRSAWLSSLSRAAEQKTPPALILTSHVFLRRLTWSAWLPSPVMGADPGPAEDLCLSRWGRKRSVLPCAQPAPWEGVGLAASWWQTLLFLISSKKKKKINK